MNEFKRIVQSYHPILFKIGRAYTDNEFDFQELYQEMLIQLWRAMPSFEEGSKLSTFIYRVALNTALTYKRSRDRRRKRFSFGSLPQDVQADEDLEEKQQTEKQIDFAVRSHSKLKT